MNNLIIETDGLWQEIQKFTTVTDASNSLQFKWCLSNLEENYLNSLNLERIIPVSFYFIFLYNLINIRFLIET